MPLASFMEMLASTAGVLLGLCGVALTLLGLIAIGERAFKTGSWTTAIGLGLLGTALWLIT